MHFEPVFPLLEIRFLRVANGRVMRKPRGDDDSRTGAQQHQCSVLANFESRTGDDGHRAVQLRALKPLGVVEVAAADAHGVVKVVHRAVFDFAHVAVPRLFELRAFAPLTRGQRLWGYEDGFFPGHSNGGVVAHGSVFGLALLQAISSQCFAEGLHFMAKRAGHPAGGDEKRSADVFRNVAQQRTVGNDGFEELSGCDNFMCSEAWQLRRHELSPYSVLGDGL